MNQTRNQQLLAVDVGNSRIKFGLFASQPSRSTPQNIPVCKRATAIARDSEIPWNEIVTWIDHSSTTKPAGIVAGANPAGVRTVLETWPNDAWGAPTVVDDPSSFPISIGVDQPRKVGIDRILNAVAVNAVRPQEHAVVIVDSGTATTIDYVSPQGTFAGGAIFPGFELAAKSLHEYTALLPRLSIDEIAGVSSSADQRNQPPDALGRDTRQALRSGAYWGQLGAVKELIAAFHSLTPDTEHDVFLTGGGAHLLARHLPDARFEPHLALQGLALVSGGCQ